MIHKLMMILIISLSSNGDVPLQYMVHAPPQIVDMMRTNEAVMNVVY